MQFKSFMEALKGKQHKIDKNKNGQIDAHDFKLLRKEETEQLEEGLDPSEVAGNPRMYSADTVKKAFYHKKASAGDKESLARHLDRHHGIKDWRKSVKEETEQLEEATVKTQKYSWGTMKTIHHGSSFNIPLHPEHHQAIAKLKDEQEHKFKTEDGKHWTARRKGDDVHFQSGNDGPKTQVKHDALKESEDRMARADYKVSPSGRKSHKEIVFNSGEEVEQIEEKSDQAKQNKTMKNMMDASRGARYKLNNPVPDAELKHKTARAQNVAIGRALRNEDAEQIDELSKSTLGSYVKKASRDSTILRKIGADFERKADAARSPGMKAASTELSNKYKSKSWSRRDGLDKAVDRLTKEEIKKDDVPFDGPYTKAQGTTKDKSGAVHTPMSRAKHLAKMAMKKQMKEDIDRLFEAKDEQEYGYEGDMALNQLATLIRCAEMIKDTLKPDTDLPEWVQSKITLASDYIVTAADYLHSELDEQAPVAPVPGMKFKNHAVMVHPETKSRVVINRKNIDNYTSDGYKEVRPGQKLKEDEEVKFSYEEFAMILEYTPGAGGVTRIRGRSYGADYSDPEGADDYDDKKPMKPTAEKRGRGRPAGSQSGARKNFGSSKLHTK